MADKGKKQKLNESDEDNNNAGAIDGELVLSIEKLQEAQDELDKINEEACEKVLAVEVEANRIRKPVYEKRNQVIKSIPDFWLTAFLSHPAIGELLTEEDQKVFKYLNNIEVEDSEDLKSGYSITLNFKPNPYFEDTKLIKAYAFSEEGTTKITATSIKWKEGMGITNGGNDEKNGNKRSHEEDSFFTWFSGGEFKAPLDEISDEIADFIKDDLWPNPLAYFNNDADEEDLEMDDDDENEGKGSPGSEDEEENDEDED